MTDFIEKSDGSYIIRNPVENDENFADKWNADEDRAKQFFYLIRQAKNDFFNINVGLDEVF